MLGREAPLAFSRPAQSLHHRLAGNQSRRRDLAAGDGIEDDRVLDRIQDLVGEHALLFREDAISCGEFCADAWALKIACSEQDSLGYAHRKTYLMH